MTDETDWLVFVRADDSSGSLIAVDVALQHERLFSHNWFEIRILLLSKQIDSNGVPTAETQKLFFDFEDDLGRWLVPTGGRFAARSTNKTARSIFVHGPYDLHIGIRTISDRHKELNIAVLPSDFSDVLALMPSQLEAALARDRRICDILDQEGDDGQSSRKTLYWIYDVAAEDRGRLDNRLEELGFTIEKHGEGSVTFARIAPVELLAIQEDTRSLFELCEEIGCTYDGWETEVIRPKFN